MHLRALARGKHGASLGGRRNLIGPKKTGIQRRSDTAETAVLLLAGLEVASLDLLHTPEEWLDFSEEIVSLPFY